MCAKKEKKRATLVYTHAQSPGIKKKIRNPPTIRGTFVRVPILHVLEARNLFTTAVMIIHSNKSYNVVGASKRLGGNKYRIILRKKKIRAESRVKNWSVF